MKTATLMFGLLTFLAGPCRADLSDSGNSYIGGQGQTVGTMTVSGSAFSVGGATFAVLSGRAGVGTSSPAYRLDVQGDVRSTGSFIGDGSLLTGLSGAGCSSCVLRTGDTMTGSLNISGAASTLTVAGSAFSVGGSTFSIGGGTVSIFSAAAKYPFRVAETAGRSVVIDGGSGIGWDGQGNNKEYQFIDAFNSGLRFSYYTEGLKFMPAANAVALFLHYDFNYPKTGIGTSAPGAKLEIKNDIAQDYVLKISSNNADVMLALDKAGVLGIGTSAPLTNFILTSSGSVILQSTSSTSGHLVFKINSASNKGLLRVQQGGKIGIGYSNPAAKVQIGIFEGAGSGDAPTTVGLSSSYLHLGGFEYGLDSYRLISFGFNRGFNGSTYYPAYMGYLETDTSTEDKGVLVFGTRNSHDDVPAVERMRIGEGGSVGIGTTWPEATLHVSSAAGSATTPILLISSGASADGQELLWVQKDGKVGVGTTAPAARLHISSGVLLLDGTANSVTAASATLTGSGAGYTLTVASGLIVSQGGSVKLSTGGLVWADGTVSTTAASGGGGGGASPCTGGVVRLSSGAVNTITSTVWTTVPESTITYTANGCQALLTYHCGFDTLSGTANVHVGVYANGALMDLQSSTQGFDYTHSVGTSGEDTLFTHLTAGTYTGTTSFAVVFYTDNSVRQGATGGVACQFAAQEVP